jgi:hypothetical protein
MGNSCYQVGEILAGATSPGNLYFVDQPFDQDESFSLIVNWIEYREGK